MITKFKAPGSRQSESNLRLVDDPSKFSQNKVMSWLLGSECMDGQLQAFCSTSKGNVEWCKLIRTAADVTDTRESVNL